MSQKRQPKKRQLRGTYVSPATSETLKTYCAATRTTESAVIEAALRQYITGTSEMAMLLRRLDRIDRSVERLHRDVTFYGEALSEWVRVWYAYTPELPDTAKREASLRSTHRYRGFVRQLATRLSGGRSLIAELVRDDGPALEQELELARAADSAAGAE